MLTCHLNLNELPEWMGETIHAQWFIDDLSAPRGYSKSEIVELERF